MTTHRPIDPDRLITRPAARPAEFVAWFKEHIVGAPINFQSTPGLTQGLAMSWDAAQAQPPQTGRERRIADLIGGLLADHHEPSETEILDIAMRVAGAMDDPSLLPMLVRWIGVADQLNQMALVTGAEHVVHAMAATLDQSF